MIFGPEPSDAELFIWCRDEFGRLEFRPVTVELAEPKLCGNPKRRQREAQRAMAEPSRQTASQRAVAELLEQRKVDRTRASRANRDEEKARRRASTVAKRKRRARGK